MKNHKLAMIVIAKLADAGLLSKYVYSILHFTCIFRNLLIVPNLVFAFNIVIIIW